MKQCIKCNENKDLRQFYTHKGMTDGRLNKCIACSKKESKANYKACDKTKRNANKNAYQARNSEKRYGWNMKHKYGITIEQFKAQEAKQKGLCGVCSMPGELVIDHCHKTGKFRGLLHRSCNSALGLLQDNPEVILAAASYVAMNGAT